MENETDSRRKREDVIRYWAPRAVAIAIGLGVGIAGFWPGGRDTVAFLANWSAFCLQAGTIYLVLFEREFLANLVIDFLEFVRRHREYRERRDADRAARQAAVKRAPTQSADARPPKSESAPSPAATPETPVSEREYPKPSTSEDQERPVAPLEKPRFRSRDGSFGVRAVLGLIFVALVGALFIVPMLSSRETAPVEEPSTNLGEQSGALPITPPDLQPLTQTHAVQDGESCWSIASGLARSGERVESIWLQIITANPELCSLQSDQTLMPGSTLTIPSSQLVRD